VRPTAAGGPARAAVGVGTGLALLALIGGGALWTATRAQNDLTARARAALAAAGISATVTYHGLDAVLTGSVARPREAAQALGLVAEVSGTRLVTSQLNIGTGGDAAPGAGSPSDTTTSPGPGASTSASAPALPPGTLTFDTGDATLTAAEKAYLDTVATFLTDHPELRLAVAGHSDGVGVDELNLPLSRRRAANVAGYLDSRGVAAARLRILAFGATAPVASNSTPEGRAANRRVQLTIEEAP
jgi:outer membrane protein OmpA-like peptidoglycan-associated protein